MGLGYKDSTLICITKLLLLKFCERNFSDSSLCKTSLARKPVVDRTGNPECLLACKTRVV